eukprot:c38259_g1_i1 orf=255-590(+)
MHPHYVHDVTVGKASPIETNDITIRLHSIGLFGSYLKHPTLKRRCRSSPKPQVQLKSHSQTTRMHTPGKCLCMYSSCMLPDGLNLDHLVKRLHPFQPIISNRLAHDEARNL